MLKRVALVLLLLVFSGVAAIFAAGHFGIELPWQIAKETETAPASKNRDYAGEREPAGEREANAKPESMIGEITEAFGNNARETKPAAGSVELDISRISPDGSSVFAGRAEPNTYVTVFEDGKPAGTVKADEHGDFSIVTEHKFASTDPKLTFEANATAPPEPEPPKTKVAAAPATAANVASDVLRKFENLVSEARKEAEQKRNAAETAKAREGAASAPLEVKPVSPEIKPVSPETSKGGSTVGGASSSATADIAARETGDTASSAPETAPGERKVAVAGAAHTAIPVPIMFVYNEATLTSEGTRAANLLLEYLKLKDLSAVELTGHADERGTDNYNFDLSRDRLETVSQMLRTGGYTGELRLTPKGKTEPYEGIDRTLYSGEALYQLDRRVELRISH